MEPSVDVSSHLRFGSAARILNQGFLRDISPQVQIPEAAQETVWPPLRSQKQFVEYK